MNMSKLNGAKEGEESFTLYPEDFDRYLPEFDSSLENQRDKYRSYLESSGMNFEYLLRKNCQSEGLVRFKTAIIDKLMRDLFSSSEEAVLHKNPSDDHPIVLMALGGYGRSEMNLYSDIDLLFLYRNKKGESLSFITERILYVLWDLGLEVGYATRTVSECRKKFFEDVTVMTSLLDSRYICGSRELAEEFSKMLKGVLKPASVQKKMIQLKMDEYRERHLKFGGSIFMLEPNIRDGEGGLRDLHLPLWIAKIQGREGSYLSLKNDHFLNDEELKQLIEGRNVLWRIRNELHALAGKKMDNLLFSFQEPIANLMGYKGEKGILPVEKFMQDYYRQAKQVSLGASLLIRRLTRLETRFKILQKLKTKPLGPLFSIEDDQVTIRGKNIFEKDPLALLKIFMEVQKLGLSLHPDARDLIRQSLPLVNENFRGLKEACDLFRGMLNRIKNLGHTLLEMHDTGFLEEWLPEFKKIHCRVQHDAYHVYTIDTHSIFAVQDLSRLYEGGYGDQFKTFRRALGEVLQPELLTLGLFLHDIGKGEGGNHSVKGAKIANGLTKRIGFNEEEQKTIEFLILSHLMMPHLSQRRDLEDPELIIQFARSMGTMDKLNMLFLLTWADVRAVGPNTWSNWKGALLERLYEKAQSVITHGGFSKEKTEERLKRIKQELIHRMGPRFNKEEVLTYLKKMPPRYFFAVSEDDIAMHIPLFLQRGETDVVMTQRYRADQNLNEVLIYTLNAPGLLSQVTGVMLAHAVNILKVDLFPTNEGYVLILVGVADALGNPRLVWDQFGEIADNLKDVLSGRVKVHDLISKRILPDYLAKNPVQKANSRVVIDNDVSAYYTVIDIYAHDRLGLLYEIMTTLNQLGMYVEVSKISTKVEQVSDVFYVKDIFGSKIISQEKLKQIKEALRKVIR